MAEIEIEIEIDNDGIGAIGETAFTTWCAQNSITAIKATPDKFGWDYYLQFAAPHGPHEPPERSCKVQVKTTGDAASADIKLDNWERMAKERSPWFVLVVQLLNREAHAVHLVHVGERQVVRVLERLRQLGEGVELHRRRMSVDAQPEDALAPPFHVGLRDRLLQHMGSSDKGYLAEKEKWIEESGYPEQRYSGTIVFDGAEADDEFYARAADWAVGLVDRLPFKKVTISETRFGITRPVKTVDGGTVKINPPSVTEVVTLSNRERSETVSVTCQQYRANAAVIPALPQKFNQIRLVAPYIALLCRMEGERGAVSFELNVPRGYGLPLSELAKVCKVLRLVSNSQEKGLTIRFGANNVGDFKSFAPGVAFDPEFVRFASLVECAASIAKHFDLDLNTPIDTDELLVDEFDIRMMHAGFNRDVNVGETLTSLRSRGELTGKKAVVIMPSVVTLGSHVAVALIATTGAAKWERIDEENGFLTLDPPEVVICSKQIMPASEWDGSDPQARIRDMVREALTRFNSQGYEVLVGPPGTAEEFAPKLDLPVAGNGGPSEPGEVATNPAQLESTSAGDPRPDTQPTPLVAVTDTNFLLDLYSCHDMTGTYNEAHARLGAEGAVDDQAVVYRRARARESLLLAMHFHNVGATTFSLHFEVVDLITRRAPPAPGGETMESDFTNAFLHFVKDYVLPNWNPTMPTAPGTEAKNDADKALVEHARARGLPLITNEGYSQAGIVEEGMRRFAREAGVQVFAPREFYQGKIDEAEEIEAFLRRFREQVPRYIEVRRREVGEDNFHLVLEWVHGYYRLILLGESAVRETPVRVAV
jgi:hypothetical protein